MQPPGFKGPGLMRGTLARLPGASRGCTPNRPSWAYSSASSASPSLQSSTKLYSTTWVCCGGAWARGRRSAGCRAATALPLLLLPPWPWPAAWPSPERRHAAAQAIALCPLQSASKGPAITYAVAERAACSLGCPLCRAHHRRHKRLALVALMHRQLLAALHGTPRVHSHP